MKTFIQKITFVMILACVVFAAQAGDGKKNKKAKDMSFSYAAAINLHQNNIVAVQFTKPADQRVTITIKDAQGNIIKQESLKKNNVMVKKYQLNDFPKGTYQVEVANGTKILTKEITVE